DEDDDEDESAEGTLYTYDLKELKEEHYVGGVSDYGLSFDRKTLVYVAERRVRVVKAASKPEGEGTNRSSGWIDLSRLSVSVVPQAEWRQMYREAWRLQRDNFWTPDMSGIDWEAVYERYLPVLERVATRAEFSDLMWEVQGELGTSHAYEFGGEYPRGVPAYRPGFLGCDLVLRDGKWQIERIVRGDSWRRPFDSPLAEPGLDVREGDVLLRVEGQPVGPEHPPGERLLHRAGEEVALVLQRGEEPPRRVVVKTIESEAELRYRAWVEGNRRWVHEQSGGRVGYLHVPNMGARGFAEFHRYYLAEFDREGLIVDVRMNGGGHVSQLLLEKLARRRVGYDVPRWGKPEPYPSDARLGPVVCLTDEHAGSDGDIFSHCFKLLGLGPLVGKRTWGGVIGIWPRHPLVDRTVTTQAEFAFWFTDVGWSVENYGTEPDVEIDRAPQDWVSGSDPQLSGGLAEVQRLIAAEQPQVPDFGPRPVLTPPRLKHR
ncbi:MAG TPA: peptidase, partial [Planctomycetes bacterium]|nr:peptidase [Planctomycetota bacterium]